MVSASSPRAGADSTPATSERIEPSWKISRVLQEYPDLLDVLIGTAPAFGRLRNPLVRRVQSRLVTIAQAAEIAGLEPAALARTLNAAAGLAPPDDVPAHPEPVGEPDDAQTAPEWVTAAPVARRLDVRPFQRRGEEPFSAIMAAARGVLPHQVLELRNTFEPTPLYDILGARGFAHWARHLAADGWEILFYNTGTARTAPPKPPQASASGATGAAWDAPSATLTIDVSELVPPEPMIRILEALENLPPGSSLLAHHVRRPLHLYPRLDELGYAHETRELGPGRVEVLIQKPGMPDGDDA